MNILLRYSWGYECPTGESCEAAAKFLRRGVALSDRMLTIQMLMLAGF